MRSITFLSLFVLSSVASAQTSIPIAGSGQKAIPDLDRLMIHFVQKINCTAGVLALSKGDTMLYQRAYGWLDQAHKFPAPVNTCIGLASCEKPITASAIRQLAIHQRLDLNVSLFATLSIRPAHGIADQRVYDITFGHLLDQKAGWGGDIRTGLEDDARKSGMRPPFTIPQLLSQVMSRPLQNEPGSTDVYSNFGYDVLRYVIEFESGRTPVAYYRQSLLHQSRCVEIGQLEELPLERRVYPVVWNVRDGGPIFASSNYLSAFMLEYWYTGEPRDDSQPLWVKYGSLPASTAVMVWRPDGLNEVAMFNGRYEKSNDDVRNALDEVLKNPGEFPPTAKPAPAGQR